MDHALWLGRKTVVFCPNTAIVGQWIDTWNRLKPDTATPAGDDRELAQDCTVLTYQSLAVFDADSDEPGIGRLHANGRALVERLHRAGPLTIVLDECHHLLQAWGSLLDELIQDLEDECVLALTATPPDRLNQAEAELVGRLFGEATYAATIPALVSAGELAPFAELAWITTPTPTESAWLDARSERTAEFLLAVTDPALPEADTSAVGLLTWLDLRFEGARTFESRSARASGSGAPGLAWAEVERQTPALADAVIRLAKDGHCQFPEGAVISERHFHKASLDDWMLVIDDWLTHHLDVRDPELAARVRAGLPAVGYRATRHGIKPGPSLVDRVLGRSESKAQGAVEIVAHTLAIADPRLLILCDHAAAATLPADLAGVLPETAGSAQRMLELLLADERTAAANPVLVTGTTVAAAPDTADILRSFAALRDPYLGARICVEHEPETGTARITGWTSKQWTPVVTAFLEAGHTRCLVGTRALLGEGWDARGITGVIDAGTATTTTAIVQTRGRSLRIDPKRPEKVAVNWTLCCIAPDRPQGDADWKRLVRKHEGWFAVDEFGDVVDGVGHLDSRFSPYEPPAVDDLSVFQARALLRAEDVASTAEDWGSLGPDRTHPLAILRVRGARLDGANRLPAAIQANGTLARTAPAPQATLAAWASTVLFVVAGSAWLAPWLLGPVLALLLVVGIVSTARLGSQRLADAAVQPGLTAYASAIADALHAEGLSPVAAEGVAVEVTPDGEYRCRLDGVPEEVSELFTTALDELLAPIARPRYLIPRPVRQPRGGALETLRAGLRGVWPDSLAWHQVPSVFGGSRACADRFAAAWRERLGGDKAVFTGTPEGRQLLIEHRGASGIDDVTTVVRRQW